MSPGARLFVLIQYLWPQHARTALVHALARIRQPAIRRGLIAGFRRLYTIDLDEAVIDDPEGFDCFNAFFTRALKPGARPVAAADAAIASPCDGTVSEAGPIDGEYLLQARVPAKAYRYTLPDLLGDPNAGRDYVGGTFATIYLAPYNYHRVHMPVAGTLLGVHYLPGALFSVNGTTARAVPRLFPRNERVVCHFATALGPMALVFVGALNVGSIAIVGHGDITPRRPRRPVRFPPSEPPRHFAKGEEIGRFNMGSTVIVLLPPGQATLDPACVAGATVRVGEAIGELRHP
jgi:phosphatidylserine decarboxylase